jgi:histidinol dehydrogenase
MPQFLSTTDPSFEQAFQALLAQKREDSPDVDATVADIIAEVRARGDAALVDLTARFDRLQLSPATLRIPDAEIDALAARVPEDERKALDMAARRIRAYHERQMPRDESWTDPLGATLGWRWTPSRPRASTSPAAPRPIRPRS